MLLAYVLIFLMGITLGVFGGGGALLSLPILVYFFKITPVEATQYSLMLVGMAALVGFFTQTQVRALRFKEVLLFLVPSLVAVFISRAWILPSLPEFFVLFGQKFEKSFVLMSAFSGVLLASSLKMIFQQKQALSPVRNKEIKVVCMGLMVGVLAGTLGAGGGFLIVPALTLLLGVEMKTAIKTSLLIIALQSMFGFVVGMLHMNHLNWSLLLSTILIAAMGILLGTRLNEKASEKKLKLFFAIFILMISIGIATEQLLSLRS